VFSGTFEDAHGLRLQSSSSGCQRSGSSSSSGKQILLCGSGSSSSSSSSSKSRHTITISTAALGSGQTPREGTTPRRGVSASGGAGSRATTPDLALSHHFGHAFAGFDALADAAAERLDDEGRLGAFLGSDDDGRPYGYDDDDGGGGSGSHHAFGHGGGGGDSRPEGFVGAYSVAARRQRIQRFLEKRQRRVWTKKQVKYDVRKNFADSRMRVKGRFVKKEDEELLRDLMSLA
jgi:hypothetical protein